MWAICRKDFASLFHSFTGWLFLAVFWALMSLYIGMYCFIGLDANIADVLPVSGTFLMILLPILCMRSFAEERKSRTDQLILTAPVTVGQVVLGKFLALGAVYTIAVAALGLYPLILSGFGEVPYAQSYVGLLGMWLFGLSEIAVCVFASALTESVIIAAVISVALLFLSLMIPTLQSMLSAEGNVLTMLLGALDIPGRFDTFLNGTLDLTAVVYLVSVAALFLFLTAQVIQKRRYQVSRNTMSSGAYSGALIAVVLAIVIVVNLAVGRLPSAVTSHDVTAGGLYSLTEETKEYLSRLEEDITIYVMASETDRDETLDATLRNMAEQTEHLTVTYVDPASNPSFLQEYSEVLDAYWNSLIVESGERYTVVDYADIYEYSVDYTTYSTTVSGYDAEGQIDSAIAYVTSEVLPKVYVLTGHGEAALESGFTEMLSKLNFESVSLDLMVSESVPEDCEVLLINGPVTDLSADDAEKILEYLSSGGDLIAVTNFETPASELPYYGQVLAFYGVTVSDGIVLENNQGYYYRYESYLLPDVASLTETEDITNGYVFMAYSQALYADEDAAQSGEITFTELLTTSDNAYIHDDVTAETTDFSKTAEDVTGQFVLALKAEVDLTSKEETGEETEELSTTGAEEDDSGGSQESGESEGDGEAGKDVEDENAEDTDGTEETKETKETEDTEETEDIEVIEDVEDVNDSGTLVSRGYIFGSAMTFSDTADQLVSGSNSALFAGVVTACVDAVGVADQISVAVKTVSSSLLTIPTMTALILCLGFIVLVPAVLLVIGFAMWFLRRRK